VLKTRLYRPFPNPFAGQVTIRYSLATDVRALLQVYDRLGCMVRSWAVSRQPSAVGAVTWNGNDDRGRELARGVYFCRFTAGDYRATEKVVLQR
jgi:flagellar hook assembly protein FlgD